ncbi:MAG: hypothetical protein WA208_15925 [Thermoanaerobaculia bacterium]
MNADDRRSFQRLKLPKPMQAVVDGLHALILDIGMSGVFVEHFGKVGTGDRFRLLFRWHGSDLEYTCEVIRSRVIRPAVGVQPPLSQTGARFVAADGTADETLSDMIATFVGRILAAQKENANATAVDGRNAEMLAQMGEARRSRSSGWITCRLWDGVWRCSYTVSPRQPPDGFTVGGFEDEDEIEQLCQTYAAANEEGRGLIRLVAELSASAVTPQTS